MIPLHEAYLSAASALERLAKNERGEKHCFGVTHILEHLMGDPPHQVRVGVDDAVHQELDTDAGAAFLLGVAKRLRKMGEAERKRDIEYHEKQLAKLREGT